MTVADAEIESAALDLLAASLERAAVAATELNQQLRQLRENMEAVKAANELLRSER